MNQEMSLFLDLVHPSHPISFVPESELKQKVCDNCGERFGKQSEFESHQNYEKVCWLPGCKQLFSTRKDLEMHIINHFSSLYCDSCQMRYSTELGFRKHLREQHGL